MDNSTSLPSLAVISVATLGVILFVGGCAEVVTSFMARTWRGFAAYLLMERQLTSCTPFVDVAPDALKRREH